LRCTRRIFSKESTRHRKTQLLVSNTRQNLSAKKWKRWNLPGKCTFRMIKNTKFENLKIPLRARIWLKDKWKIFTGRNISWDQMHAKKSSKEKALW